jgi:uncharacterized protein YjbI with pentapeptide repeats
MNDETRLVIDDAETPVNPYSLLTAVNTASGSANTAWLIFLGLMAYLLVALAGVTHRDLLLNSDVALPILQVKIDLARFFVAAPIILLLLHAGLLGQLALLARKTLEFTSALKMLETTDRPTHPLRLELDNFFFVQALAGPERSRVVSAFLNSTTWLTLVILPVMLLLYVQLAFLPYHDAAVTLVHRLVLLADIALLLLIGVFLMRPETTFFGALLRTGANNPGSLAFGIVVLAAAAFFSLVVATIPDRADREGASAGLFSGPDGAVFGVFPRNLDVADINFVADKDVKPGEPSINLRGRDLRFARLDRADLHQADMTGANLDGASLIGADLRHIWLQCGDGNALVVNKNREAAKCASARGANFSKARLAEAKLSGVDVRGAQFQEARMEGSILNYALMAGANLSHARLERADLSGGTALQGVNLHRANLQGADLGGARLQLADMSGVSMPGANLALANLEGTVLREADLEGANMQQAKLFGADLRGAKLSMADMSGAMIWRTVPPAGESIAFTDMANVVMNAPSEEEIGQTKSAVAALDTGPLKVRLTSLMAPLHDAGPNVTWGGSADGQAWTGLAKTSEAAMVDGYRARITEQLVRLACRARFAGGAVATGIARRAAGAGFKGDAAGVYDRLKAADCPASTTIPPGALRELAAAADAARGL